MKECNNIQEKLTYYLEGLLDKKEEKAVDRHLGSCERCADELKSLKSAMAAVGSLDEVEPPPWLTAKIMSRINEEGEVKEGFFRRLFFPLHIKVPIQALAAIFVVVLSVQVYRSTTPDMQRAEHPPLEKGLAAIQPDKVAPGETPAPGVKKMPDLSKEQERLTAKVPAAVKGSPDDIWRARETPASEAGNGDSPARLYRMPALQGDLPERALSEKTLAPPASKSATTTMSPNRITVYAEKPFETAMEIQKILHSLGGSKIGQRQTKEKTIIFGEIDGRAFDELEDRLKKIGETVREKDISLTVSPDSADIEIVIFPADRDRDEPF